MTPYDDAEDHQFWRRAVSETEYFDLDIYPNPRFRIGIDDRIVTAGSCFAQHLARALQAAGFNYLVTEDGAGLSEEQRRGRQYGLFSARYGNIYTTAHLRQLLEEAFGRRRPEGIAVRRKEDGRFVDLLRPYVEPDGYGSEAEVWEARQRLLESVRRMVREGDVFVFTMGMTEGWRMRDSDMVLPVAPGVVAGSFDQTRHEYVNHGFAEVRQDLEAALALIWEHRPEMRVILTVSPVHMIATYERQHVLVSSTYSKSVLRVVAEEVQASDERVLYFPGYELVAGHHHQGHYLNEDLREVSPPGLAHVIRVVMSSLVERDETAAAPPDDDDPGLEDVFCDEDEIARIL